MDVTVREASWVDGEAIRDVHVAAVEGLASRVYDDDQIAAWIDDLTPADYAIDDRATYFVVAEDGDRVVGFGCLNTDPGTYFHRTVEGELTAAYVRPSVARNGVGSRIYEDIEAWARVEGLASIGLWSSRNAVPFYEAHGYGRVAERIHEFATGVRGSVVEMYKPLAVGGHGR